MQLALAARAVELFAVELRTTCWEEMVEWYREVLQLRVLVRVVEDQYALLEAGSIRLAILARSSTEPASARWSLAFEVAEFEELLEHLSNSGASVAPPTASSEGYRSVVVTDPDGNRIRLFAWPRRH